MAEFIAQSIENSCSTITLARPELHNAFNEVVIDELTEAFHDVGARDDVRVVILAGQGKSFCAGADINWMKRMVGYSFEENVADADAMASMLRAIRDCPKPVIARVHGAAIGGGVGLTAACDISVALDKAIFSLSEVKLGIIPAVISPFVLEKIGPGHARRYGLTAERFNGVEARRIGLVHETADTIETLDAIIARLVDALKSNSPGALTACKQTLTDVAGMPWDEIQRRTTQRIAELRVCEEGQEGLKAFLEKRKPAWID